jgi:hypothetical protein
MVPFDVKVGGQRVSISFESLIWFFIVTAGATVLGELIYDKYVSPYLKDLPNLPGACPCPAVVATVPPSSAAPIKAGPGIGRLKTVGRGRA